MSNEIKLTDDLRAPDIVKNPEERMKFLVNKSQNVIVEHSLPIRLYFSSGRQLLQMANTYLDEKNMEHAFVLYMRYITLFVEKLPLHPKYDEINDQEKKSVRINLKSLFLLAEEIKMRIKKNYTEEYDEYLRKKKIYDENLEKFQQELLEKRQKDQKNLEDQKMQDYVENLQKQIDNKKRELADKKNKIDENEKSKEVEEKQNDDHDDNDDEDEAEKEEKNDKLMDPTTTNVIKKSKPPIIDRSTKPSMSLLDDVDRGTLRSMIIPFKVLTKKFTNIAQQNTDRNIETCGILCGQLKRDSFTITHVLIPKQTGTSDSCTSINEEELLIEQERYNLITLGWIHTHPTQRSFLSSIDLHTHAFYQKMLPESIAIVVAPKTSEIQMYTLTENGLEYILKCHEKGFHPHSNESSLYQFADHTIIDDNLNVNIIDLR